MHSQLHLHGARPWFQGQRVPNAYPAHFSPGQLRTLQGSEARMETKWPLILVGGAVLAAGVLWYAVSR